MSELIDFLVSKVPKYETKLPSTNKKLRFRPFLVREEKILLLAQEMNTSSEKLNAIAELIENCFDGIKGVKTLPLFDIEYLFLKLRAKSVGESVDSILVCPETNEKIDIHINLDEIEVRKTKGHTSTLRLRDDLVVELNYPNIKILEELDKEHLNFTDDKKTYEVVAECIKKIETPNTSYTKDSLSKEERIEFLNNLTRNQFDVILNFFMTSPKIETKIEYQTSDGVDRTLLLSGLLDFFV